ncbi:MAG: A/G-specific adenine glycosylase [Sphaerochaetaceae bacterium]|nr:A/G-specific adenine glycosylase [Sphaerochaetaceae bacterium]
MDKSWMQMTQNLLEWYAKNARVLPWRTDPTPYHVWLSEIMLQQTRVEAVMGYYTRFLSVLPDIQALANADEEQYLKLWEGLGYYSRVRNLHKAAELVVNQYQGELPHTKKELQKLPGIGSYTAGAIASIAYGQREPAVDGNVLRILARVSADSRDILEPKVKTEAERTFKSIMDLQDKTFRAGDFNQALMDLGATVCLPNGKPKCEACPLSAFCKAHQTGHETDYPTRLKKTKRKIEERTVLLLQYKDRFAIHRRPDTGLLAGLYELPNMLGTVDEEGAKELSQDLGFSIGEVHFMGKAKHIFSHIEWHMTGYHLIVDELQENALKNAGYQFQTIKDIKFSYTLPSAFSFYYRYLAELKLQFS